MDFKRRKRRLVRGNVPINFPLIKVCNKKYYGLSNFYNKKIDQFKIKAPEGLITRRESTYDQEDGLQFHNLLDINQDLKKEQLKNIVCKELAIKNTKLRYHYFHPPTSCQKALPCPIFYYCFGL